VLNIDGSVSEITEEWFEGTDEETLNTLKENSNNIDSLTDPDDILIAKIYKQVQSSIEGADSA
jgi:hypothetical protein